MTFFHRKNLKEYFIIENRQKVGRDLAIPGSGLAIWHVDETGNNENHDRLADSHNECPLVQADGQFDFEHGNLTVDLKDNYHGEMKDLYYLPNNTNFGDVTQPNSKWWDDSSSGLDIIV